MVAVPKTTISVRLIIRFEAAGNQGYFSFMNERAITSGHWWRRLYGAAALVT